MYNSFLFKHQHAKYYNEIDIATIHITTQTPINSVFMKEQEQEYTVQYSLIQ